MLPRYVSGLSALLVTVNPAAPLSVVAVKMDAGVIGVVSFYRRNGVAI